MNDDTEAIASADAPLFDEVGTETAQPVVETPEEGAQADAEPSTATTETDAKPQKKGGVQQRIAELTWKHKEAERALEQERQRAERMQQAALELWRQQQASQARGNAPRVDQYQSVEEYQQALWNHFEAHQQQITKTQQQFAEAQQQQLREVQRQHAVQSAMTEGEKKYPDFREKVSSASLPNLQTVNPPLFEAVMTSDRSADVAYYLANNAVEAHRIANLPPIHALRELGRIEEKLAAPSKSISQAPAPITTLGSNGTASKDPSKMGNEEYRAWRMKKGS